MLRKLLVDYSRLEDDRDPRKDLILNMWRFVIVLFHNDPFYRERIGWVLWQIHGAIEEGVFGYEHLYAVNDKGEPVGCLCGYDPEDWFGAPAGRGWKSTEKLDWYKLTPEELEQSELLVNERRKMIFERMVAEGLIPKEVYERYAKELNSSTD